jgi:hypothetical protein
MNHFCGANSVLVDTLLIFNIGTFEANLSLYKKWGGSAKSPHCNGGDF